MAAKECADEQEQRQSRVAMSEGDGQSEGQRGGKGDDQRDGLSQSQPECRSASVTISRELRPELRPEWR